MSQSLFKIRAEALLTKHGGYFKAVIPGISRRFWLGGLPLISSTLPLLRPDDDRTGLVMVSHNNCEHQCSFSRCRDFSVFASFFCFLSLYFCDGLPIFRALLQPDDDRTSLVMVLHNNCNHPTCAQWVLSFFLSFLGWGADFRVSCGFALQTANTANTTNKISGRACCWKHLLDRCFASARVIWFGHFQNITHVIMLICLWLHEGLS